MPFSFTQIEKSKSRIIGIAFCFLILLYFITIWGITFLIHNYAAFDAFMSGKSIPWENMGLFKNLSVLTVALIIASMHWLFIVAGLKERLIRLLKAQPFDLNDPEQKMFQNIIEELRVELPGQQEQAADVETRERDDRGEEEYERRAEGMPAQQAAAIAIEITTDRQKEEGGL